MNHGMGGGTIQMPSDQGGLQFPGQHGRPNNTSGADNTTDSNPQFPGFGSPGGMTPPDGMEMPNGMEMPEGMENIFPGQSSTKQGSFPDRGQDGNAPAQGNNPWALVAATIVILAAGLLFALKFKR